MLRRFLCPRPHYIIMGVVGFSALPLSLMAVTPQLARAVYHKNSSANLANLEWVNRPRSNEIPDSLSSILRRNPTTDWVSGGQFRGQTLDCVAPFGLSVCQWQ